MIELPHVDWTMAMDPGLGASRICAILESPAANEAPAVPKLHLLGFAPLLGNADRAFIINGVKLVRLEHTIDAVVGE